MFRLSILLSLTAAFLVGCATKDPLSPKAQYFNAKKNFDEGNYSQGYQVFQSIIEKYPETKYANYAFLLMADSQFESGVANVTGTTTLNDALANYEIFLRLNPQSPLTPYVMYRMIFINYVLNTEGFLTVGTDPNVLEQIIDNYKRFYLLYPKNSYFLDSKIILVGSRQKLAEYEMMVGDWYYDRKLYNAASARYEYIIKEFPQFEKIKLVAEKLIDTYELNQQAHLAEAVKKIYQEIYEAKQ